MTAALQNESFLLGQFREFYTEVIRLKQYIEANGGMTKKQPGEVEILNDNGDVEGYVTAKLPPLESVLLETLSGREKITSLAVRGTLDTTEQMKSEETPLTLTVWQNLLILFR